jgi:hypothetical protein
MWLPCKEASGTSVANLVNATAATTTGTWGTGFSGSGAAVLASTQKISIPVSASLGNAYTYCGWFYATTLSSTLRYIFSDNGAYQALMISNTAMIVDSYYTSTLHDVSSSGSYGHALNTWYFVAVIRDPANLLMHFYQYTPSTSAWYSDSYSITQANLSSGSSPAMLGSSSANGFVGRLENWKVFNNVALPQSDIKRIMLGKHPLTRS